MSVFKADAWELSQAWEGNARGERKREIAIGRYLKGGWSGDPKHGPRPISDGR